MGHGLAEGRQGRVAGKGQGGTLQPGGGLEPALAGFPGGITCNVKDGVLCCDYNIFLIERVYSESKGKLPVGKVNLEVVSKLTTKVGAPMDITLKVNVKVVAEGAGASDRRNSLRRQ